MRLGKSWVITALFVGMSVPSFAAGKGPCAADVQKFCSDVKPGHERIGACLKQHKDELSDACKAGMAEMRQGMKEAHEACRDDQEKFCKDVKPGDGRLIRCLKEHKDDLSQGCKDKVKELKERRRATQAPAEHATPPTAPAETH